MRTCQLCGHTAFRKLLRSAVATPIRTISQGTSLSSSVRDVGGSSSSGASATVAPETISWSNVSSSLSSSPVTSDCAAILKYPYQVISTEKELKEAVGVLQRSRQIAIDIEAFCTSEATKTPQLGRVSLVQTCSDVVPVVFLFDVLSLSVPIFTQVIRPVFNDETIRKLFFDCRRDIEALSTQMSLVPKRVLDLQLLFTAVQWKLRSVNRRSGMTYVLKNVAGIHRQEGDFAVQTAMVVGDRPVWDTRPLPEHFLEYAADDVRHIHLLSTYFPSLTQQVSEAAVERLTEQYVQHYGVGHAVTVEADAQPAQVNTAWLERYIGPGGVCSFCGSKGHTEMECFRKLNGNVRCSFCGGVGHTARNCFQKHPELLKCDRCGQLGHSTANCFRANPCKHCGGNHRSENCHYRAHTANA
ncbi:hypothetical protein LPMP_342840 [Leishmania panamensis]|uniref:CCHC-type domain-containing protein n=1 Tax=Leishmania panamensis TaxID=5679 RepID=A0A088S2V5_LEIPA|nr:hypothetical protein LPMP_342840 [Leishmania panamensis]AIO01910.1 hypothetical protein LPMP_342840 [Leishmania panamensis]